MAISLVLLIGAVLALQSFDRLTRVQPGFDPAQVLTFRVEIPPQRYATPTARQAFFDATLGRCLDASRRGARRRGQRVALPGRWRHVV
jgi:putative ABC transport system permease protein